MTTNSYSHRPGSLEEKKAHVAQLLQEKKRDLQLFPLSFAQQRLWFLQQLEPASSIYTISTAFSLSGSLHLGLLERSFQTIISRHSVLRTSFLSIGTQVFQFVAPHRPWHIVTIDLKLLSPLQQRHLATQLMQKEARKPFNLKQGPLFRCTILSLNEQEHILLLSMHHIISDGQSVTLLLKELSELYSAYISGATPSLPTLPLQYTDFALWQRQQLQGSKLQTLLTYWKGHLAAAPEFVSLPPDHTRPTVQTFQGATQTFIINASLYHALQALAQEEQVTLFMVLLAAFATILSRYTRQQDICIGTPIAQRTRTEFEQLLGMFVNTLVLRIDLSHTPSFRTLLQRVHTTTIHAYTHQELPFEQLVEELQPTRSITHSPLFQVMFGLHPALSSAFVLPGLEISPIETIDRGVSKFDLICSIEEGPERLTATLQYNTDLFETATIQRFWQHYIIVLESVLADPGRSVFQVPLLSVDQQISLIEGWNTTEAHYDPIVCLHKAIEAQAALQPDTIAVVLRGATLTYQELNCRANQLAHWLHHHGVQPDIPVAICMHRSFEMIIGLVGILKAGGAYVPLDPTYPSERIKFLLMDMDISILITHASVQEHFTEITGLRLLSLDTSWKQLAQEATDNFVSAVTLDHLAYVIYTSGSTGKPKGVMVPHRGVVNRLQWGQHTIYQLSPKDCVLQKTSYTFDVSVWEIFWPLSTGARLILAEPDAQRDSTSLIKTIVEENVTITHFVPSMLRTFLHEPLAHTCRSLNVVICSGEALTLDLQHQFFALLDAELYNLYGPTEASIETSFWKCRREQSLPMVPIGHPIANVRLYVLDDCYQAVPIGIPGELFIAGICLARGYWEQPGLTATRFLPDPFSKGPGGRMYRTGDVVRYLHTGAIEFLGRIDHQVKVRGFRIELGEIETVLRQYDTVSDTIVLVRDDIQQLVAYLVPHPSLDPFTQEQSTKPQQEKPIAHRDVSHFVTAIRQWLKATLPAYMIPSHFIVLDAFPRTSTGKIDLQALPSPTQEHVISNVIARDKAPDTAIEKQLASIWKEVLHLEKVSIYDNFFDLGGHSLLMAQVYQQLHTSVPSLTMLDLFKYPTIATLAEHITQNKAGSSTPRHQRDMAREREQGKNRLNQWRSQKQRQLKGTRGL